MTKNEQIAALRTALATVLGDADHGQNMTWTERCAIGRAALAAAPAQPANAALRTALETLRKRAKTLRKSRDLVGPAEYHDDWPKMKVWQKAMYDVGKEFDEAIRDILAAAPAQPQENDKPVGELTVREPWLDGDEP